MDLKSIFEAKFGEKTAAAPEQEKQASQELTDEQLNAALSQMTPEQKVALAKEIAADIKKEAEAAEAESDAEVEKQAEELFAAGRIMARGFIEETKQAQAGEEEVVEEKTALDEFAEILTKEVEGK